MKKRSLRNLGLIALVMLMSVSTSMSQGPGRGAGTQKGPGEKGPGCVKNIPNFTEEQEKKIEELKTKHLKEITALKNNLKIKQAELNALEASEKPDMAGINKKIDEISALTNELMKKGAAHRQEVRKILTEEQRVYFDAHGGKGRGDGPEPGFGKGFGAPDCNNHGKRACPYK